MACATDSGRFTSDDPSGFNIRGLHAGPEGRGGVKGGKGGKVQMRSLQPPAWYQVWVLAIRNVQFYLRNPELMLAKLFTYIFMGGFMGAQQTQRPGQDRGQFRRMHKELCPLSAMRKPSEVCCAVASAFDVFACDVKCDVICDVMCIGCRPDVSSVAPGHGHGRLQPLRCAVDLHVCLHAHALRDRLLRLEPGARRGEASPLPCTLLPWGRPLPSMQSQVTKSIQTLLGSCPVAHGRSSVRIPETC